MTNQYKATIAKLNLTRSVLEQKPEDAERSKYAVLHGKKITVKCKTNCYVHHIITNGGIKSAKYMKSQPDQNLEFAKLKVKTINNWKCPAPNFKIDDIFVKESINDILMRDLQERALKVSGDQIISGNLIHYISAPSLHLMCLVLNYFDIWVLGNHNFTNLHATNVSIPLDIATRSTNQIMYMKEAEVKDLYIIEDAFFLPLNGPTAVMNASITATKVRITGPVEMLGRIRGKGIEKLKPLKEIFTPLILHGDRFLQNVTVRKFVRAKDIVRSHGLSVKEILENSVPLDSNISAHLILSSDKTVIILKSISACACDGFSNLFYF